MPLKISRVLIDDRLREVRALLSFIKVYESKETPPKDAEEVKIIRGMFYVHLYGALEQSLNDAVTSFLQAVADLGPKNRELALHFLPTAMNSQFKSLSDERTDKKWKRRVDFVNSIQSDEACRIENSVFAIHLQSSSTETLAQVASYLGVSSSPLLLNPDRHYIDEVVAKRHQVAHGRANPSTIGARGRAAELELRLDAVGRTVDLFIGLLENHFQLYAFLNPDGYARLAMTNLPDAA